MPFFENLFIALAERIERYEHQDFLASVTGVCALVARANGHVGASERARFDRVIKLLSRLHCYEAEDVRARFNEDLALIKADQASAQKDILKTLKETIRSKSDKELILKICWAMSRADGEVDRQEQAMITKIAKELDLNHREIFDHY